MKVKDIDTAIEFLDFAYDWFYRENEGKDVRYDWSRGNSSMWLREDGCIEGEVPPKVKKELEESGILEI